MRTLRPPARVNKGSQLARRTNLKCHRNPVFNTRVARVPGAPRRSYDGAVWSDLGRKRRVKAALNRMRVPATVFRAYGHKLMM